MDLVTQGLLGAVSARAAAPEREGVVAASIGFVAGLLPDADALVRSDNDPLLFLEVHRHYTHALIAVPAIALLATLAAQLVVRARVPFWRLYGYALLGSVLAGVLDACTSYGTWLFWPFVDRPVALSIVAIVDPVVTVVLGLGLVLGLRAGAGTRAPRMALVCVAAYLALGAIQHERATQVALALAADRGRTPQRTLVKPTIANLLLWRSVSVADGRLQADGIWLPPFAEARVYPGESALLVDPREARAASDPIAPLADALPRLARLSGELLVRHPRRNDMVGDARYAMLPTEIAPLWGIAPDPRPGTAGYRFVTERSLSDGDRRRFLDMLLGRPLR